MLAIESVCTACSCWLCIKLHAPRSDACERFDITPGYLSAGCSTGLKAVSCILIERSRVISFERVPVPGIDRCDECPYRDAYKLADAVFYFRHPELRGRRIGKEQIELKNQ